MTVLTTSTASKVVKIDTFKGSRPDRPLYIYLPAGYGDDPSLAYPVIYMQDGQNCFDTFIHDSFAHSTWQADRTADLLIAKGVSHERDIWGQDVAHDWDWWRQQVVHHLGKTFG